MWRSSAFGLVALLACSAKPPARTPVVDLTDVGVRWELKDWECTSDDCPGGWRVDVALIVVQGGTTQRRALGQLTADSDNDPVGVKRCTWTLTSVACSGVPQQNEYSLELRGNDLVVLRSDWVDEKDPGPGQLVATIALAGAGPHRLVAAPAP
jgi:hypothetical protein